MDVTTILQLVKYRLGITSTVRDEYITYIIKGIISELTNNYGLILDPTDISQITLIADWVAWKYKSVDLNESDAGMPQWLRFAIHNLRIKAARNDI